MMSEERVAKLKRLAQAAPKDFGPSAATWEYVEALDPDFILALLADRDELKARVVALEEVTRYVVGCDCTACKDIRTFLARATANTGERK